MKKVLSYILISLIISANLLAPISVGVNKNGVEIKKNLANAADDCKFISVKFSPPTNLDETTPDSVSLEIVTSGCIGQIFNGSIEEKGTGLAILDNPIKNLLLLNQTIKTDSFSIKIKPGEKNCTSNIGSACKSNLLLYIKDTNSSLLDKYKSSSDGNGGDDVLYFKCKGNKCDSKLDWSVTNTVGTNESISSFTMIPLADKTSITVLGEGPQIIDDITTTSDDNIIVGIYDESGNNLIETAKVCDPKNLNNCTKSNPIIYNVEKELLNGTTIKYYTTFSGLNTGTSYTVKLTTNLLNIPLLRNKMFVLNGIYTLDEFGQTVVPLPEGLKDRAVADTQKNNPPMPACAIIGYSGTFMGCVAQAFYYVLFVPTSYLFALAGTLFDSTFAYSVQDSSYRSAFVVQGWGLIRDFCNMFFIFIMLYIAIGTILSLNSVKTKEAIINVVIIGLFINFSLFATQVIIDASNITARVFYNADSIKITEKGVVGATNVIAKVGEGGVIPLSAALVNKINPQNLIINSDKINDVKDKGGKSDVEGLGISSFILIVLVTSAINIVGFTVFITVAFLFIARVIGLWLAMLLAPLAFFTYILPEMAGTKMIGWKHWWPDTLKLAFLAPVFIFFLYLILKFLEINLIADAINKTGLDWFVATIIPFIFIMIFMMKAKKIAVDMSGEFGEMATKAGSAIGGMALGGAVGIGAMAMRGTIGRMGSSIANSDSIQQAAAKKGIMGMGARMLLSGGKKAGSGSFDVRNTKAGSMAGGGLGVDMGKAKEGGFVKARADKTAARQQRAKDLELSVDSTQRKELMKKQMEQKRLEDEFSVPLHKIDNDLTAAKTRFAEAASGSDEQKKEAENIRGLNEQKAAYTRGGAARDAAGNITGYNTTNGNISQTTITAVANNLTKAENEFTEANQAQADAIHALDPLGPIITNMNAAIANNTQAQADLLVAQTAATAAATAAAAPGASTADAINHTNALSIQAAAQAKLDKTNSEIQTTTTTYNNANLAKQTADNKLTIAGNNRLTTRQDNYEATAAAAIAMAPGGKGLGRSINDLKFTDIPHDELAINKRNNRVKGEFAEYLGSGANKVANFLSSGGVHDFDGDFEAMYKIKMDAKIENSGGGQGGGVSHTAPAPTPRPATATPAAPAATHR